MQLPNSRVSTDHAIYTTTEKMGAYNCTGGEVHEEAFDFVTF